MMDEDVFLEETLIKYEEDEEALVLLRDEGLASRLSKWKRPNLSPSHLSQSQSIGNFLFSLLDFPPILDLFSIFWSFFVM